VLGESYCLGYGPAAGSSEDDDKPSGSIGG
jgi:hypothetical protein